MSSICSPLSSNALSGISALTQSSSGLFANLPVQVTSSMLQSASPHDVVALSEAALKLQQVDGILGITPPNQNSAASPAVVPAAASSASSAKPASTSTSASTATSATAASGSTPALPSGVPEADVTNATPEQQAALANQAVQQQQVQSLFYPTPNQTGLLDLSG